MVTEPKVTPDEREAVFNAANRAESAYALSAMIKLARGIPGVIVNHEELDAAPDLLNVTNGTVDLRTGRLRPHDPADLCTKQVPVRYDPASVAPLWKACVERWQPDSEILDYIQREIGAGATGYATETLSIHHGGGANGKSKFFGAIQSILGPYSVEPHKSLLITTKHDQHATVIADLFRVRLAVSSETKATAQLDDEQVKNLTGGDRLRGRRIREDPWSFNPSHTLVMFSNHRPRVQGVDEGIWRRVRLVDWPTTIPVAERDEYLSDKLAAEASGILLWIVDGAQRYLTEGLKAPDKVRLDTDKYRLAEDTVGSFIAEAIDFDSRADVESSKLVDLHAQWAADNGLAADAHWKKVATRLREQGATPERRNRGRYWRGIRLRPSTRMTPVPYNAYAAAI